MTLILSARAMWWAILLGITLIEYVFANTSSIGRSVPYYVCPLRFVPLAGSCYFFSKERSTWQNAFWKCENYNSSLAILSQPDEDIILRNYLNDNVSGNVERWIGGLYDWKQSQWVWGATAEPLKYQGFSRMKNKDPKHMWHCIILDPKLQNKWNARKCLANKHFVCRTDMKDVVVKPIQNDAHVVNAEEVGFIRKSKDNPQKKKRKDKRIYACKGEMMLLGNKCYTFSQDPETWNEANWACRENGTRLAVIQGKPQNDKLKKLLNRGFVEKQERWLGGIFDWKKNLWKWAMSGADIKYRNFHKHHPTNQDQLRWHCITMDPRVQHEWSSSVCTEKRHYICQTKAHTVKIRKKSGEKPGAKVVIELYKGKASKDLQYRAGIETKVYTPRPRRPNFYRSMDRPPGTRVSPPPKKFFEAGTS